MGSRGKRIYTGRERERAVRRAGEVGPREAGRELGIPSGTVAFWQHVARKRTEGGGASVATALEASGALAPTDGAAAQAGDGEAQPGDARKPGVAGPGPVKQGTGQSAARGGAASRRRSTARSYTPSEKARALERVAELGLRPAARELGIERGTLRAWKRKVERAARGAGPSPTSGPDPKTVEAQRDQAILAEWRKQPGLGPSQIKNQLRRAGMKTSVQTVRRVMEDGGYVPPRVKRSEHTERYEAVRPNQLWHLDFLHRFIHGQKVFVLVLLDDYSRFAVGWAMDDAERADAVISCFEAAVARYGRPEAVMHDGGSAFWSWRGVSRFIRLLEEYGVDSIKANVPQVNGKSEVFNANLQKELFDRVTFDDVGELRHRLGPHLWWYNYRRTHHALGGLLVPADRYHGRADEVLSRLEAGGQATDSLDLAGRALDLLRLTSQKGRLEVWLMGHKLLDVPA